MMKSLGIKVYNWWSGHVKPKFIDHYPYIDTYKYGGSFSWFIVSELENLSYIYK